jgi:chemotaxis protein CheD
LAIGSCIGVVILDQKNGMAGMVHVVLPDSKVNPEKAAQKPGYFADTGVRALLKKMVALGCHPKGKGLVVKLAGGAQVMDPNGVFNIGKRNFLGVKKTLWRYRLGAIAEDVGGSFSRTVNVEPGTGRMVISSPGKPDWEL